MLGVFRYNNDLVRKTSEDAEIEIKVPLFQDTRFRHFDSDGLLVGFNPF